MSSKVNTSSSPIYRNIFDDNQPKRDEIFNLNTKLISFESFKNNNYSSSLEVSTNKFFSLSPSKMVNSVQKIHDFSISNISASPYKKNHISLPVQTFSFDQPLTLKTPITKLDQGVNHSPPKRKKISQKKTSNLKSAAQQIKSPYLYRNVDNTSTLGLDNHYLFPGLTSLRLIEVGKGVYHKCWRTEFTVIDEETKKSVTTIYAIKSFNGDINPNDQIGILIDTEMAYDQITQREKNFGDIRAAKWLNKETVRNDGFYVYEFVEGPKPTFEHVIKNLFKGMLLNHSKILFDFRPDNVRIVNGEIIIIDPSFNHDNDCLDMVFYNSLKSWLIDNNDEIIDFDVMKDLIRDYDQLNLENEHYEFWQIIKSKLNEKLIKTPSSETSEEAYHVYPDESFLNS